MKFKYEPPKLVDLRGEQVGRGFCSPGSQDSSWCTSGNRAAGTQCQTGTSNTGLCHTGTSASAGCTTGNFFNSGELLLLLLGIMR
jgi:hypothetical protein